MEFLLFRLYGPLASWGEIAVGESRHSATYPGKSALLGLLAAAQGIRRDEEDRQRALADGYRFAVKVISAGHLLRDYHTTQAPDSVGKFTYRTRRDELIIGKSRLGTVLSSREYRCDGYSLVAVQAMESAPIPLRELQEALRKPKFHLYLGRKSCPLSAPLNPSLVQAKDCIAALDEYRHGPLYLSNKLLREAEKENVGKVSSDVVPSLAGLSPEDSFALFVKQRQVYYYWEGEIDNLPAQQVLTRRDHPLSRVRWQFTTRVENMLTAGRAE